MAGNSWDVVKEGSGKTWYTGRLEMLPVMERTNSPDYADSTPSTDWDEGTVNLTSIIGTDVVGVFGALDIREDGNGHAICSVREVGDTAATDSQRAWRSGILFRAERVSGQIRFSGCIIVPCKGTAPGKFQVAQYSSWWDLDYIEFVVQGRIRP